MTANSVTCLINIPGTVKHAPTIYSLEKCLLISMLISITQRKDQERLTINRKMYHGSQSANTLNKTSKRDNIIDSKEDRSSIG